MALTMFGALVKFFCLWFGAATFFVLVLVDLPVAWANLVEANGRNRAIFLVLFFAGAFSVYTFFNFIKDVQDSRKQPQELKNRLRMGKLRSRKKTKKRRNN